MEIRHTPIYSVIQYVCLLRYYTGHAYNFSPFMSIGIIIRGYHDNPAHEHEQDYNDNIAHEHDLENDKCVQSKVSKIPNLLLTLVKESRTSRN